MKRSVFILCGLLIALTDGLFAQGAAKKPAVLIAYFSRSQNISLSGGNVDATSQASVNLVRGAYVGNTELLAEWIRQDVGGDLFAVKTVTPYSSNMGVSVNQGQKENREKARPALVTRVPNMEKYDVVFVGFPTWWYDMPMAMYTFFETYDLSGKTIVPFCTSGGSGFSNTVKTIRELEPKATVREGLSVMDTETLQSERAVKDWLDKLGY